MRAQGYEPVCEILRSEFNSLHPLQINLGSRGLRHYDASVLTLFTKSMRSGLESRRKFHMGG
jgi:hypothetical protein